MDVSRGLVQSARDMPMPDEPVVAGGTHGLTTESFLRSLCARELEGLRVWTEVRHWRLLLTASATALSLFLAFPGVRWGDLAMNGPAWKALQQQIAEPFQPQDYSPETHQSKMAFRLTVPLFARMTGIGVRGAAVLHLLSGVALLYLGIALGVAATGDRVIAALIALATASTYLGASAFWDARGYFDALAISLVLSAMLSRSAPLAGLFILLAAFTDERALGAALLAHLWFVARGLLRGRSGSRAWMPGPSRGILAAAVAYACLRWFLGHRFGLASPMGEAALVGPGSLWGQLDGFVFGFWSLLEGLWLPVLAAAGLLWLQFRLAGLFLAGVLMAQVVGAHCVLDVTRSGMYVFPVVFIAAAVLAAHEARDTLRLVFLVAALVCVLAPTGHLQANEVILCRTLPAWLARLFY